MWVSAVCKCQNANALSQTDFDRLPAKYVYACKNRLEDNFRLIEVGAMVVAVQQLSAEFTAMFTVHKTCLDPQWNGYQNSALMKDRR